MLTLYTCIKSVVHSRVSKHSGARAASAHPGLNVGKREKNLKWRGKKKWQIISKFSFLMLHLLCRSICLHLTAPFPSTCTRTQTPYTGFSSEDRATTEHSRNKRKEGDGWRREAIRTKYENSNEGDKERKDLVACRGAETHEKKKITDMQGRIPAIQRRSRTFWVRRVRTPLASAVLIS